MAIKYRELRNRMKQSGIKSYVLAKEMGIGTSTLSRKLNGEFPFTTTEIERMCRCIGIANIEIGKMFFPNLEGENT